MFVKFTLKEVKILQKKINLHLIDNKEYMFL
jgi:hypothetical protein